MFNWMFAALSANYLRSLAAMESLVLFAKLNPRYRHLLVSRLSVYPTSESSCRRASHLPTAALGVVRRWIHP